MITFLTKVTGMECWSDVAVDRGDDGYGKRWMHFLAVVYKM